MHYYRHPQHLRKIVTISELASHYSIHRNTMARHAKDADLRDFWSTFLFVQQLEKRYNKTVQKDMHKCTI